MNKERMKVQEVIAVFSARAWLVFRPSDSRPIAAATSSGQELVDMANRNRWAIQNKLSLRPDLRAQLIY